MPDFAETEAATLASPRLSPATLSSKPSLPAGVTGPAIDPQALSIGIVHFGIGAFHRAHQAVYTEDAAAVAGETRWGILGVTGRTESVVGQLRPQDCLYGVLEKGAADTALRLVGSVREAVWPGRDSERVVEVLANPSTHLATLTITEKGYLRRADGSLDIESPAVQHDLALIARELVGEPDLPVSKTALGLLVRGLARRYRVGGAPFTIISCDNVVGNGAMTRKLVTSLVESMHVDDAAGTATEAVASGERMLAWLEESVAFPSTMVDRIAPATTEADRIEAAELVGLRDEALVVAEPFKQWVIEDRFAGPRPAWEDAGAILTYDVSGYERVKLRILNASHLFLAYLGALKGFATIAEAVADAELRRVLRSVIDDDVIPTLDPPRGVDVQKYRDTVIERFANPALAHTTLQVAMDGSMKIPIRILGTASDRLEAGSSPDGMALVLAAWMTFVASTMTADGPELDDPLADSLTTAVGSADAIEVDADAMVRRVLGIGEIFPPELVRSTALRRAIVAQFAVVRSLVSRATE